jgi:PAS domain S-box-containing protein
MPQPIAPSNDMDVSFLLNDAPVALILADAAGTIIWATAAAAAIFALDPADLPGRSLPVLLGINQLDDILGQTPSSRLGGTPLAVALNNGNQIFVAATATDHETPAGARGFSVVLQDVTVWQQKASKLKRALDWLDLALDGAGIGVFEIDLVTGKSTVSPGWLSMMGLPSGTHIDSPGLFLEKIHPDDRATVEAADRDCIEGRSDRSVSVFRMKSCDDKHWRWMRSIAVVGSRDADGKATHLVGAQTDITEQREAEEALRLTMEESLSSFESAPIGKAIVGLDGRWLQVNSALCDLLGYPRQMLLETDFQTVTYPDDLEADLDQLRALVAGKASTYRREKRYVRSDGTIILADLSVAMVRDKAGAPLHLIAQILDITEQRNLEQMKSHFVANVSHELRTPLTSILGALGLLASRSEDEFPDDVNRLIYIAQQNAERLKMRVSDILDFEGLTTGQLRLSLAPERIASLLDRSLMNSLVFAESHGVSIEMDPLDRSIVSAVDADRFEQVMSNLLSNAAKFADRGSVIRVGMTSSDEMVSVHVTNRGPKIPDKYRAVLFKPFAHIEKSVAQKRDGTGLGLSICKQIVEQMGGKIGFESEDGTTTFWFTLPPLT